MKNFFTIIGGMGTEATEVFIHILNERTPAKRDQDYLDYILVNHATVPDRTDYILDHSKPDPFIPLAEDIKQQSRLHPDFFVIPCNTAHYRFDDLQSMTDIPILHMPRETVKDIPNYVPNAKRVGLIATKGTLHDASMIKRSKMPGMNWLSQMRKPLIKPWSSSMMTSKKKIRWTPDSITRFFRRW